MALALAFAALLLLVAAVRGTQAQLFAQLANDIPGFALWLGAIILIGLIGYIPGADPISKGLLALVLLVLVLGNGNSAFPNFVAAFKAPPAATTAPPAAAAPLDKLPVQIFGLGPSSSGVPGAPAAAATGAAGAPL